MDEHLGTFRDVRVRGISLGLDFGRGVFGTGKSGWCFCSRVFWTERLISGNA